MPKGGNKCPKCDRTFSLPMHLARHMSAMHGAGPRKKAKKTGARRGRPPGRRRGRPAGSRMGRPTAVVSRLGLKSLGLDDLKQVIEAAKDEARRRLSELESMFG